MRVLIIDDDYVTRAKLKGILSKCGDCDGAPDGETAVQLFKKAHGESAPYELITVDIEMKGMDGQEVVQAIREWEKDNKVPAGQKAKILMITVKKEIKEVSNAYFEGCDAYCVKPFTPETIADSLKKMDL